jgi:hypothetical protein
MKSLKLWFSRVLIYLASRVIDLALEIEWANTDYIDISPGGTDDE